MFDASEILISIVITTIPRRRKKSLSHLSLLLHPPSLLTPLEPTCQGPFQNQILAFPTGQWQFILASSQSGCQSLSESHNTPGSPPSQGPCLSCRAKPGALARGSPTDGMGREAVPLESPGKMPCCSSLCACCRAVAASAFMMVCSNPATAELHY